MSESDWIIIPIGENKSHVPTTDQTISCIFFGGSSSAPGLRRFYRRGPTRFQWSRGNHPEPSIFWIWNSPMKNMSSSVGVITAKIWKNKIHVPNHQPEKVTMFPVAKFIFPSPNFLGPRPKFQAWTFKTSLSLPTSQGKPRG